MKKIYCYILRCKGHIYNVEPSYDLQIIKQRTRVILKDLLYKRIITPNELQVEVDKLQLIVNDLRELNKINKAYRNKQKQIKKRLQYVKQCL